MQAYIMKYWRYAFNTLDLILGKINVRLSSYTSTNKVQKGIRKPPWPSKCSSTDSERLTYIQHVIP